MNDKCYLSVWMGQTIDSRDWKLPSHELVPYRVITLFRGHFNKEGSELQYKTA